MYARHVMIRGPIGGSRGHRVQTSLSTQAGGGWAHA